MGESGRPSKRQKRAGNNGEDEINFEDEDENEHYEDGQAKKAVFHWQIWRQLLRRARWVDLLEYSLLLSCFLKNSADEITANEKPRCGDDPVDITAPYETQITWDLENRSLWPPRLHLWQCPNTLKNPTYDIGILRHKGHVVLDTWEEPIRDFRIPLTICSRVEGLRIEAWMRGDNRLTLGDIEARLWTKIVPGVGRRPSFDRRVLSKRASLDRCRTGLISWLPKRGRDEQTAFMDSLRTPEQRAKNQVTDQDLNTQQRAHYAKIGLNESKQSNAPTRAERIRKIKRAAEGDDTMAVLDPGAGTEPADSVDPASEKDDDAMDIDDTDEARSVTQVQEQTTEEDSDTEGSVSSSLLDPFDSRHEPPTNSLERAFLRQAIDVTVQDFRDLAQQQPELPDEYDNYYSQWGVLQQQWRALWEAEGNTSQAPVLKSRGRWTDGISQYEFAEIQRGKQSAE